MYENILLFILTHKIITMKTNSHKTMIFLRNWTIQKNYVQLLLLVLFQNNWEHLSNYFTVNIKKR